MDANDQPPEFLMSTYTFMVPEDTPINTRFEMISASDGDTAPNAVIVYSSTLNSECYDNCSGRLVKILNFVPTKENA